MFDEPFRRAFPAMVGGPVRALARAGVTPNQVTVAACALGVGAGVLVGAHHPRLALVAWLASRVLDGVDGVLARETGRGTPFGGVLDLTLDMLAYGAMVVGFAVVHPAHPIAWTLILVGYLLVTTLTLAVASLLEGLQARGGLTNRSIAFTPGYAEAGETTAVYVLLLLVPQFTVAIAWTWIALLAATVVQRLAFARRVLANGPSA
ncbi:MAG: CDP-alcohol phosphatidyltransferase family protein [Gemmatimonadetes bacterium]|nr:CDP-alcohol phosphatidyltransferase family protein [Gemmatimonadota bacterium]